MMSSRSLRVFTFAGLCSLSPFASQVQGYEAMEVANGGSIVGTVAFAGDAPVPVKLEITKDQAACGKTEKVDESLLVGSDNGLQNVVVSIANIEKGKKMPAEGPTLDQKDCRYAPHVMISPAGAEVTILNSDGILHNIHTYSEKNPAFNKAQPKFKKKMKESFAEPETVKMTCDAHSWMTGWLVVQGHPYYAVTDEKGMFSLTDVPAGDYELKFWHEVLGETTQKVSVKAGEETKVSAEMVKK
jgi:plastocyanin